MGEILPQREWLRVTLASIGDAVIMTNNLGQVIFLNAVAESLTGFSLQEAAGQPLDTVFHIVSELTGERVENPALRALRQGVVVGPANHSLQISRNGAAKPIDHKVAPIHDDRGRTVGVAVIFRDISERRNAEQDLKKALAYAANIIATLREPFLVLDCELRVKTANRSFYDLFRVSKGDRKSPGVRPGQRAMEHSRPANAAGGCRVEASVCV